MLFACNNMHNYNLPLVWEWGVTTPLMFRIADWYLDTHIWEHPIGLSFKVQAVTIEDWTDC